LLEDLLTNKEQRTKNKEKRTRNRRQKYRSTEGLIAMSNKNICHLADPMLYTDVGSGCAISVLRADNEDLQKALLPVGFLDGLEQMLDDTPSMKTYYPLYYPMSSYGALW